MSSYMAKARNKKTDAIVEVFCIDDFFGKHRYGYKIGDAQPLTSKAFYEKYEIVR